MSYVGGSSLNMTLRTIDLIWQLIMLSLLMKNMSIAPSNRTNTLRVLEQNLKNLPVCDEFLKSFLIFSCATLLAPNSKLEGSHDLWDTIWDGDVGVQRNWAKFLLQHLEDGIRKYRQKQPTYIRGCLMFFQVQ